MSGLEIKRIASQLAGCIVGQDIHLFETLESTMDAAKKLAKEGAVEGTVVIAEEQMAGRGRFDRSWMSEPGKDLLFSVVFRPEAAQAPYINMAAALSVCSTVGHATGLDTAIKWPNDVKLAGRKVSGILVESMVSRSNIEYTVLGVGLNVNSNHPPAARSPRWAHRNLPHAVRRQPRGGRVGPRAGPSYGLPVRPPPCIPKGVNIARR